MSALQLICPHAPRTGGLLFGRVLHQFMAPPSWQQPSDDLMPHIGLPESPWHKDKEGFLKLWYASKEYRDLDSYPFYHGHKPFAMLQGLNASARWVFWVRHPITLVLSNWFFARQLMQLPQSVTIFDYLDMPDRRNWLTLYSGDDLSKYDFVGVLEYLHTDMLILGKLLGWNVEELQLPVVNRGANPDYTRTRWAELLTDPKVVDEIIRVNRDDMDLYHEALMWRTEDPCRSRFWRKEI